MLTAVDRFGSYGRSNGADTVADVGVVVSAFLLTPFFT